jgi:hypothetical protein
MYYARLTWMSELEITHFIQNLSFDAARICPHNVIMACFRPTKSIAVRFLFHNFIKPAL